MKITSIKDPMIVEARKLHASSFRKQHKKALIYGMEQLQWALKANVEVERIFIKEGDKTLSHNLLIKDKIIELSEGILKKISGTKYLVPYLGVINFENNVNITNDNFIVVLDNIIDLGNIGSIIRTSKGFSINNFIMSHMDYDPYQRKIIDASRGLVFNSDFLIKEKTDDVVRYLKKHNYQIIVTSPHAKKLQSQLPLSSKPIALIIGNESSGV